MKAGTLIANLMESEAQTDQKDPLGLKVKLIAALDAIGPVGDGERGKMVLLMHRVIADAIYLAHLMAMIGYNVDRFLEGTARMLDRLGRLTFFASQSRPKVNMVGIVSNGLLLPVACQTDAEADSIRKAFQAMVGNGGSQMHLIQVEVSSTQVDTRIQPQRIEHHIGQPTEAKPVVMVNESEEEIQASTAALAAALAPSNGDQARGK